MSKAFVWIIFISFHLAHIYGARVRRHLVFTPGSKLFLGVDVRNNLFDYSDFFAQSVGFKISWDLPDRINNENTKRIQRRDLHMGMEHLLNQYNLNGSSCLRKFEREVELNSRHNDDLRFFNQLLKIIFSNRKKETDDRNFTWQKEDSEDCSISLLSSTLKVM